MLIRESGPGDLAQVEALYPAAFPTEDLLPVVRELYRPGAPAQCFVALDGDRIVGHVGYTICGVEGRDDKVALLAPLAVHPGHQRRGVGSALIREGARRLAGMQINVLGDPGYYGRHGFVQDDLLSPPYPLPAEWRSAWQAIGGTGGKPDVAGVLKPPAFWMRPELWGP